VSSAPSSSGIDDGDMRRLLLLPVVWVALLSVAAILVPKDGLPVLFRVSNESAKVIWLYACVSAALAFQPGDYLRGAWFYFAGACFGVLLRDVTLLFSLGDPVRDDLLRIAILAIANASQVASSWRFGRAWKVAELPDSEKSHLRAYIVVGILVVVVWGGAMFIDVRAALGGDRMALVSIASQLGDFASLCMLAPVLPTALALRGGSLAWPWSMMAACIGGWLAYDVSRAMASVIPMSAALTSTLQESARGAACVFALLSAIAQRRVSSVAHRAASPPHDGPALGTLT